MNFFLHSCPLERHNGARQNLLSSAVLMVGQLKNFLTILQHPRREVDFCG